MTTPTETAAGTTTAPTTAPHAAPPTGEVGPAAPPKRRVWILPREHGAYAQLALPLIVALVLGAPTVAAYALVVAVLATFVGQESARVLIGFRGKRKREKLHADAVRWAVGCAAVAVAGAVVAIATSTPATWLALSVPAGMGVVSVALVLTKREHSTVGESIAAVTLASCAVPVAIAGGVAWPFAWLTMASFAAAFVAATIAVRAVIANHKRALSISARLIRVAVAILLPIVVGGVGMTVGPGAWSVAVAMLPVCALAVGLLLRMPHPKRLRQVGWTLAAASVAMTIGVAVALSVAATSGGEFIAGI